MTSPAVKRFAAHEVEVSATLAMARVRASGVEWLLLGDSGILVPSAAGIDFHTDDRLARVASRQRATLRRYRRELPREGAIIRAAAAELTREESRHRNRDGGFWVLSNHSSSASHAREGAAPKRSQSRRGDHFHLHRGHSRRRICHRCRASGFPANDSEPPKAHERETVFISAVGRVQ